MNEAEVRDDSNMVKHAAVRPGLTPSEQSGLKSDKVVAGEALAKGEEAKKEFDRSTKLF